MKALPQPFEGYRPVAYRYGPDVACRVEAHAPCGITYGDWRLIGLEARDELASKNGEDEILDYEPRRRPQRPPSSRTTSPGRLTFETGGDPLKNPEVLRAYLEIAGTEMSASGRFRCPTPQHEDVHPSAQVWPDGRWKCFSCNAGGDVVDVAGYRESREPNGADYWWLRDHVLETLLRAPLRSETGRR